MESEVPPVITLEQRKDFVDTDEQPRHSNESFIAPNLDIKEKPENSKTSSVVQDGDDTQEKANVTEENQAISDEHVFLTGPKLLVVLASVTLVFFLVLLDMSIISTAIPRITSDFHSLEDVGWYGAAYNLASASLQPLTGKFYTHFKTKWTFLCFFAVFELGSLLCGVSQSSKMLVISRAVAGMGTSGLMNGALTILTAAAPMEKRPLFTGIMMGFSQLGLISGPLIGGAFTEFTTWRWCFYINLPIGGLVAILLVWVNIPDANVKTDAGTTGFDFFKKLDLVGFCLFAPSSIMLLLALQYGGNQFAWNSATVIGLFIGAGATFIVFMLWDWRVGENAMVPTFLVRQRVVWSSCAVMIFNMTLVFLASFYLPIYFQTVKGASPLKSGVDMLPSILSQMLFSVFSGFMVGKLGYYIPWSIGSSILSAVGYGLITTFSSTTPSREWIGYQVLIGAGRGCGMQMPLVAIQANVPLSQISVAMSILVFCQTFGGAVFLTFAQTILTQSLRSQIPKYAPGVDPETVIDVGATAVRDVVSKRQLAGVLQAYAKSVDRVFYLAVGAACGVFLFAWGMKWTDVRKKKAPAKKGEA
ncbi:MAG: hypothetical protein M1820_005920 [Bogoriella megaspora]|nr:MAG: hypothetical protein M1820_005920 [Bogoriella megaspora]